MLGSSNPRLLTINEGRLYSLKIHEKKIGYGTVKGCIDLARLFKIDITQKKEEPRSVELVLHFFNKNYNPQELPVWKKYFFDVDELKKLLKVLKEEAKKVGRYNIRCEINQI